MLSTHLTTTVAPTSHHDSPSAITYSACTCFSISLSPVFSSTCFWIVDSGATRHICSNANLFIALRPVQNSSVTLPDHTRLAVAFSGDIQLCNKLLLKNVLYVPQFKFNLLSISALTKDSQVTTHFFPNYFVL